MRGPRAGRLRRPIVLVAALIPGTLSAQATFTPSFNAPYRAFQHYEFGGTLSIPHGPAEIGLEGQFRFGFKEFDIGARAGLVTYDATDDQFVAGIEGRGRVVTHGPRFPLDGAVIVGVGTGEFDNFILPAGLSLGRRVTLEEFSFVAYGQPTLFIISNGDTDVEFGLGFGVDFAVRRALDLRISFGVGNGPEGLAVSLVWVR